MDTVEQEPHYYSWNRSPLQEVLLQSISQVNPSAEQIEYGDTGNASDTCYFGWNNEAPGAFSGTWTDPQSGSKYNDSSGWDYSGEYFQWQRPWELIY